MTNVIPTNKARTVPNIKPIDTPGADAVSTSHGLNTLHYTVSARPKKKAVQR